jgi:hypothetical protein
MNKNLLFKYKYYTKKIKKIKKWDVEIVNQ